MAKKRADKIDPAAKPRAPRRTAKSSAAAAPAAAIDVAAGVTTPSQRAEAADTALSVAASDAPTAVTSDPSFDDIARAAYERYLSRGGNHGRDFDDWLEAERELRRR